MTESGRRLRGFERGVVEARLDAFYVSCLTNIRYLSGFTGSAAQLLAEPGRATLFVDGRYGAQAEQETDGLEIVVSTPPRKPFDDLADTLVRRRVRRLGFESESLSHASWSRLSDRAPSCRLAGLAGRVEELRTIKSAAEVAAIQRAAKLNDEAFAQACSALRPSWTERRLAAEIDYRMARLGARGPAFDTIVASGEHGALPHAQPRTRTLKAGSLIVVDHGAILGDYVSDMTRMIALGTPSPEEQSLLEAVLEAQQTALESVKAGVKAGAVDAKARAVLERHGLAEAFRHSTGHGVGLEIHEGPRIGPGEDVRLKAGMVITIEPGAYVPGLGGARIEDLVAVTPTGCDVLSSTPRDLLVL